MSEMFGTYTVARLREELKSRGLPIYGTKAELIKRLTANCGEAPQQAPVSDGLVADLQNMTISSAPTTITTTPPPPTSTTTPPPPPKLTPTPAPAPAPFMRNIDAVCKAQLESMGKNGFEVFEDFDAMLAQVSIAQNLHKFYLMQIIQSENEFAFWARWGRVGEAGMHKIIFFPTREAAIEEFQQKFRGKTKNDWADRNNMTHHPGKYTLIQIFRDIKPAQTPQQNVEANQTASKLETETQELIKTIFSRTILTKCLQQLGLDVMKMPFGKWTKLQISKANQVLLEIEKELNNPDAQNNKTIVFETSMFYTLLPHSFGLRLPPVIDSFEKLQQKREMLRILAEIEVAQNLLLSAEHNDNQVECLYDLLANEMHLLPKLSQEYEILEKYMTATSHRGTIENIWTLNRAGEQASVAAHMQIENRKLLWHPASPAMIASILSQGLKTVSHGHLGQGIYHASEQSKAVEWFGIEGASFGDSVFMLLNEVVLGKQFEVFEQSPNLVNAPSGFDSVWARGKQEPDPSKETTICGEWGRIAVPQAPPLPQSGCENSRFDQSEFVVYSASQVRLKFLVQIKL